MKSETHARNFPSAAKDTVYVKRATKQNSINAPQETGKKYPLKRGFLKCEKLPGKAYIAIRIYNVLLNSTTFPHSVGN